MATECIVKIIFVIIVSQPHSNCLGQKMFVRDYSNCKYI